MGTHYDALGVHRTTSQADIKKAYKRLALEHHPDKTGSADTSAFKKITEAYSVLNDEVKRKAYDRELDEEKIPRYAGGADGGSFARNAGPTAREREAFKREADEIMKDIFQKDKRIIQEVKNNDGYNPYSKRDFHQWVKQQANTMGANDESVRRKTEEYEKQQAKDRMEQEERRRRMQEIEDELRRSKEAEQAKSAMNKVEAQQRERDYNDRRQDLLKQLEQEEKTFATRMRAIEQKWASQHREERAALEEKFRSEITKMRRRNCEA